MMIHLNRGLFGKCIMVAMLLIVLHSRLTYGDDVPTAGGEPATKPAKTAAVSALGTLEPKSLAEVNAPVAGIVNKVFVNFNDRVQAGQILAELDAAGYQADLQIARAGCERAEAEVIQAQTRLQLSNLQLDRQKEQAKAANAGAAALDLALADVKLAEAGLSVEKAALEQSRAALKKSELNVERTRIHSPMSGVVLDCRLSVGQAVGATGTNPGLFLIAGDLSRMQASVDVPESQIARIHPGQSARLTVPAFLDRATQGRVSSIRLNATRVKNVTSYSVILDVENADQKLLPYLTVNVEFAQ